MAMMSVGEMGVTVNESVVAMAMGMFCACRHFFVVIMLVVLMWLMGVLMAMPFSKVEPNAKGHEAAAD